jgi:transcriptional regulator with XRE-family HTH domain
MPSPVRPALGAAVKTIREKKGLSQMRLSETTGFRQSWISDVEHGRRNPSWTSIIRLAEGLGVKPSQLVSHAEALADEHG